MSTPNCISGRETLCSNFKIESPSSTGIPVFRVQGQDKDRGEYSVEKVILYHMMAHLCMTKIDVQTMGRAKPAADLDPQWRKRKKERKKERKKMKTPQCSRTSHVRHSTVLSPQDSLSDVMWCCTVTSLWFYVGIPKLVCNEIWPDDLWHRSNGSDY